MKEKMVNALKEMEADASQFEKGCVRKQLMEAGYDMKGKVKTMFHDIRVASETLPEEWFEKNKSILRYANWGTELATRVAIEAKVFQ